MNKELNLCELLKGHEGETFYSPINGDIKLHHIQLGQDYPIIFLDEDGDFVSGTKDGKPYIYAKECLIFPSKDQRDWNEWAKQNKIPKIKTWSELREKLNSFCLACTASKSEMADGTEKGTPIEKSAHALIKIHSLIEFGYGGNVTEDEWSNDKSKHYIVYNSITSFQISKTYRDKYHIAFHTRQQAEEFLSYPENVQLLKNYFMIN